MPRCGSTAISDFCKEQNISFFGGRDMQFWPDNKQRFPKLYQCVEDHVGKKRYEDSLVFSNARNPYSRAVSIYQHWSWKSAEKFEDFCNAIKNNIFPDLAAKWHSTTITEQILNKDNLKVDFVLRQENLQQDFNTLCAKIGIPEQELPRKNASKSYRNNIHYTKYYNKQAEKIIAEKYARDIEYFGYNFGD